MRKTNFVSLSIGFAAVGFLAGVLPAFAQLLPADRATTWNPGIPGGVPARSTVCATLSPPSGDAAAAVQAAINACPAGQVVQLSSGTFTINSGIIFLNKGVTLRGAGANLTTLRRTNGAQPGTYIPGSAPDPVVILGPSRWHSTGTSFDLAADGAKGATSVQLATAPASGSPPDRSSWSTRRPWPEVVLLRGLRPVLPGMVRPAGKTARPDPGDRLVERQHRHLHHSLPHYFRGWRTPRR